MNHLDEGTIHAWLDGALSATQVREIEAHVSQCGPCAEAVAEARGLIAGSSRILNALDDVPAGVTPKRSAAPKRQWRAAPWVTGIAAALMLAVGVTTWRDSTRVGADFETKAESTSSVEATDASPIPSPIAGGTAGAAVPSVRDGAREERATPPSGSESAKDASKPSAGFAGGRAIPTQAPPPAASGQSAVSSPAITVDEAARRRDAGTFSRQAQSPPPSAAASNAEESARAVAGRSQFRESLRKAASAGNAQAVGDSASPDTSAAKLAVDSRPKRSFIPAPMRLEEIVITGVTGVSDLDRAAGCYRPQVASGGRGLTRDLKAAAAERGAGAGRAAAPAAAPSERADYAPPVPPLLRLDTLRHPLGYAVRDAMSATSTVGSWRLIRGDSVVVDLLASGLFVFATKNRVACPEK